MRATPLDHISRSEKLATKRVEFLVGHLTSSRLAERCRASRRRLAEFTKAIWSIVKVAIEKICTEPEDTAAGSTCGTQASGLKIEEAWLGHRPSHRTLLVEIGVGKPLIAKGQRIAHSRGVAFLAAVSHCCAISPFDTLAHAGPTFA
jgi:hypothetical protein